MNFPLPSEILYDDGERRLTLRPARCEDVDALLEALHESLTELRAFMPWAHFRQTHEVQSERLRAIEAGFHTGGDFVFHAFEGPQERFVGCFGFHDRTLNKDAAELGYWVRTSAAGKGVATLASKMLVLAAFEHLSCVRIQCAYNAANTASRKVQSRLGFREEGRLRYFEMQGDDVMREDGYATDPVTVMNALTIEDLPRLAWSGDIRPHLSVQFAVG